MAEPYENQKVIDLLKDYFGFRLILYNQDNNEALTNSTTPKNRKTSKIKF
jgi:hypothetical protein